MNISFRPPRFDVGNTIRMKSSFLAGDRTGIENKTGVITKSECAVYIVIKEPDGTGQMLQAEWSYHVLIDGEEARGVNEGQIIGG